MPDITLVNLNMLFMRYGQEVERERHVPLGCLYLVSVLEEAGYDVDLRDYQMCDTLEPFDMNVLLDFLKDPAPVIGLSCMANLLPFTIMALRAIKERYPDRKLLLGGVGPKCVEDQILRRFPWVEVICHGEGEETILELMSALKGNGDLSRIRGISYRDGSGVHDNGERPRISNLDALPFPAFHKIDLKQYAGYGMMTSRGCPYLCTFCSVAPVWNWQTFHRGPASIVSEMKHLQKEAGVDLFLFQDEFFISGKQQVMDFCAELQRQKVSVEWKAFGRVNLTDVEMMKAMADNGCIELRFGIESGSDRILKRIKKGFTTAQVLDLIPKAVEIFNRVDCFYVWGYPFETMEDFNQSLFQMVSFRMMGGRILPSLLSLLPQTEIYQELKDQVTLEFCPYLFPEFVFTGHEVCHGSEVEIPPKYASYFQLILDNPDIFPGFFHVDLKTNVLPKLDLLRQFGFYPEAKGPAAATPAPLRLEPQELATRVER